MKSSSATATEAATAAATQGIGAPTKVLSPSMAATTTASSSPSPARIPPASNPTGNRKSDAFSSIDFDIGAGRGMGGR